VAWLGQFFFATGTYATEELENEQEQIQEEREAVQAELSEAEAELVALIADLESLNDHLHNLSEKIEANEDMIEETEAEISETENQVEELEAEMDRLQEDIDERFELLKDRASSYQRNGSGNGAYIEVILGAESFGDFMSRVMTISKIAQADNDFIEQLEANQLELEEVQLQHVESLLALANKATELEEMQDELDEQKEEVERVRDDMKENEAEQEALIAKLVDQDLDLASQEADVRNRIKDEVKRQEEQRAEAARQAEQEAKEREAAEAEKERESAEAKSSESNTSSPSRSNSNNNSSSDGSWQTFSATAYTASCNGCSGITSTGINLKDNPNAKVIAVDPSVIPLGSRVEVKGYGTFIAADTGGNITGQKIDIFMSNRSNALAFGRQSVQIRILN
jgi:3D (Asp-Asp-Asp) domain-containing protein/peptidoglycan hydrolase CwlO-like protein